MSVQPPLCPTSPVAALTRVFGKTLRFLRESWPECPELGFRILAAVGGFFSISWGGGGGGWGRGLQPEGGEGAKVSMRIWEMGVVPSGSFKAPIQLDLPLHIADHCWMLALTITVLLMVDTSPCK